MTWTWRMEKVGGEVLTRGLPREGFGSQGDAESWIGENWRGLLDKGVDQVSLLDGARVEYGPMSLYPDLHQREQQQLRPVDRTGEPIEAS